MMLLFLYCFKFALYTNQSRTDLFSPYFQNTVMIKNHLFW
jgi:hypothetical protein